MPKQPPDVKRADQLSGQEILLGGLLIFLVAAILRGIHLVQIIPAPFFPFKMGDAASYDTWARTIADGNWLGTEVFYQAPLYPYFLGFIYALWGDDTFTIRLCQLLVGSLSCVLLAGAGWQLFSKRVGLLAGLIMAAYAPAIFFDSLLQKSVLDSLFFCLALLLYGLLVNHPRRDLAFALGAAMGGFVLTRENALVLLPAILAWLVWPAGQWRKPRWQPAVICLAGLAAILFPVAVRNYVVGGEFHLTTSQFGPNFYIGNNPEADGSYRPLRPRRGSAKHERLDAQELAEAAVGRPLSPAEISQYWTRQSLQFIRSQPGHWARLMGRKFMYVWNAMELVDTEDQYTYEEWSTVLRLSGSLFHFGVLVPLAFFGIWCTWSRRRELWLLYALIGFYAAGVVMFYVVGRYRYPLAPLLILFAAAGVVGASAFLRTARRGTAVAAGVSTLLVALFCNVPVGTKQQMQSMTHYNVGVELDAIGQLDMAISEYRIVLQLQPEHAGAHNNLGCDYLVLGQLDDAERHLTEAVQLSPTFDEAYYNLGATFMEQARHEQAVRCFTRLVQLQPRLARSHVALGLALEKTGKRTDAVAAFQTALEIDPQFEPAAQALAALRARSLREK